MQRVWNAWLLGRAVLVALLAALAVAGGASARSNAASSSAGGLSTLDYPIVVHIEGAANKTCADLDAYGADGAAWLELKFDSGDLPSVGTSKTLSDSYLGVTLSQTATDVWSWTSTKGVDAVFVKSGASGHNLYVYDPPTEATAGSGLTVPGNNGTSHVAFCYDKEQTPPPAEDGALKVVKVLAGDVPDGVTFGDFSFAVDGGAAVRFDSDAASDELELAAGTSHDVVEPEANGQGYTTSYSDECTDGVIGAGQTLVCTITNTFQSDGSEDPGDVGPPPTPHSPPPPPSHPGESMDVQVVKDATPHVQLANGQADIGYAIRVKNTGPNQAHDVVVSDPAPGGVTFVAVVTQPENGSCTVTPALLDCTLGTLGPGVERTIAVSARVTQTGTYSNCATVVGDGGDTNAVNNTDCAETLVTAPLTPPVLTPPSTPQPKPHAKPKAKPQHDMCRILKVNTRMVQASGERHVLVAKVTRSRNPVKGVKVRFKGAGVSKTARTNRKGVARITVRTRQAGIIRVDVVNATACNTARIGVVGVFQPPVTG